MAAPAPQAATVDPMTAAFDPRPLKGYMEGLGVPYFYLQEPIMDRAKGGELQGTSICAYCARMKRGLLYACCRNPAGATELGELAAASGGLITVHALDVTKADSVKALADELSGVAIDVLINNGAMNPDESGQQFGGDIDYDAWAETMDTNVYGVMRVTKALLPSLLLSEQKKLIHIGTRAGSVGSQLLETGRKGQFIYRSSKAALNVVAKLLDVELAELGVLTLIIHPGHVATDMGGNTAPLTPEQSVSGMVRCIEFLEPALDGDANARFVWYDGRSISW